MKRYSDAIDFFIKRQRAAKKRPDNLEKKYSQKKVQKDCVSNKIRVYLNSNWIKQKN